MPRGALIASVGKILCRHDDCLAVRWRVVFLVELNSLVGGQTSSYLEPVRVQGNWEMSGLLLENIRQSVPLNLRGGQVFMPSEGQFVSAGRKADRIHTPLQAPRAHNIFQMDGFAEVGKQTTTTKQKRRHRQPSRPQLSDVMMSQDLWPRELFSNRKRQSLYAGLTTWEALYGFIPHNMMLARSGL